MQAADKRNNRSVCLLTRSSGQRDDFSKPWRVHDPKAIKLSNALEVSIEDAASLDDSNEIEDSAGELVKLVAHVPMMALCGQDRAVCNESSGNLSQVNKSKAEKIVQTPHSGKGSWKVGTVRLA